MFDFRESIGFLILLSGFSAAMSIPRPLDAIGLSADEELVGT